MEYLRSKAPNCPIPLQADTLTDANFDRLSRFIYSHCGIRITGPKRTMIDGRLRRRMRALGMSDINHYCRFLFDSGEADAEAELVHFIDAVTTNKTDFFREPVHFEFLKRRILPELVQEGRTPIRMWSAACSMGAEPYTLAMVMEDFHQHNRGVDFSILASDISTAVLGKAIEGTFPLAMIDPVPEEYRKRFVMVSRDPQSPAFRIKPALRSKISFFQMNLMDARFPVGRDFDVVFCRNVLIYFDRQTQKQVLSRLCSHVRRGGYLILGHSESVSGLDLPLELLENTVFRRV